MGYEVEYNEYNNNTYLRLQFSSLLPYFYIILLFLCYSSEETSDSLLHSIYFTALRTFLD